MRKSITSKLVKMHLIITIFSLIVFSLIINFSFRHYMENNEKKRLNSNADILAKVLKKKAAKVDRGQNDYRVQINNILKRSLKKQEIYYYILTYNLEVLLQDENGQALDRLVWKKIKYKISRKSAAIFRFTKNNKEYYGVIREVYLKNDRCWLIAYSALDELIEMRNIVDKISFLSFIITGIMAIFLGIMLARSITKPIILIKEIADKISRRDFNTAIETNTGDELELLGKSINKMAKDLQDYDIAQKKFFQNASHELKTPLMSIQGYAEGLKDGVFDDQEKTLNIIIDETFRLERIIKDIIFLTKLETVTDFYDFSPYNLNKIIRICNEKINGYALKNNKKIILNLNCDIELKIDQEKFIQAVINILGNAIRYARDKIKVESFINKDYASIEISDDGDGFAENESNYVFERFYKGKNGNTGLGLTISKLIIEKHRGEIKAVNGANGAVFKIKLPLYYKE